MTFLQLAQYFKQLEQITSRNTMTEVLAKLFKQTSVAEIGKVCYLLQGRVAPLYEPVEFGMATKMVVRAISDGLGISQTQVWQMFKQTGDLGNTVEKLKNPSPRLVGLGPKNSKPITTTQNLKVTEVYHKLYDIAQTKGEGSQEAKIKLLGDLLKSIDPLSACYVIRIILGKLRLGFSDMTILDALSWKLTGSKQAKDILEKAYNVRPDLAFIAQTAKQQGLAGFKQVIPKPGTPIRMAKANRLTTSAEILDKICKCSVEYKYDGLRLQAHFKKLKTSFDPAQDGQSSTLRLRSGLDIRLSSVEAMVSEVEPSKLKANNGYFIKLFSRNLEDMTEMFPDICEAIAKQVQAEEAIFEGEVVAYNPSTGVFVPFQQTMQRKRKYDIAKKAAEIPVKLFCFELLYLNGNSFLDKPYFERKQQLKHIIKPDSVLIYAPETIVADEVKLDQVFEDAVDKHFEGILAKKLDGLYEAGVRGWNWIKFKKAMSKKLADTLDVLIMGYTKGEGKRTEFGLGQFLTGIYDEKQDKFVTISKIGTGLTDEQFRTLFKKVTKLHAREKPPLYEVDKLLYPDIWLEPELVVEVSSDEITRSAVHTAGRTMKPSVSGKALTVDQSGYALRFPRLVGFRDDKRPEDITTLDEVKHMFAKQSK